MTTSAKLSETNLINTTLLLRSKEKIIGTKRGKMIMNYGVSSSIISFVVPVTQYNI